MLTAKGITAKQFGDSKDGRLAEYVSIVENTTLPEEYSDLSPDEMKELSREILYDSFYNDSKTMIMSPIERFVRLLINVLTQRWKALPQDVKLYW